MAGLEPVSYDITSTANPTIKRLSGLRERSTRDAEDVFVVEGLRLFNRAVESGLEPIEVYVDGSVESGWDSAVLVHPEALDRASYRKRSEGVIAVFPQVRMTLTDLHPADPALILVTDSVEKPGNLGAVLRTADAVGADAVIETGPVDLFNPNVLRSSTGACFTVPTLVCKLNDLVPWLEERGIRLFAADPLAEMTLWEADLTGPIAIMIGAEDAGLSPAALALADQRFSIPMTGRTDSLNTSVAMAVFAYEAVRQRRQDS